MRTSLIVALALVVGSAATADLPVYCRLLAVGLQEAVRHPIVTEDLNVSTMVHVPIMGDVDVSISHLAIAGMKMIECDAYVNEHGVFEVGMKRLDITLSQIAWQYRGRRWPHVADNGDASGTTGASFNVEIDMTRDDDKLFKLKLDTFDISLGAKQHKWLSSALMKLVKFLRPVVSEVVHVEARKTLDQSLGFIRQKGGCVFLEGMLKDVEFVKFAFTSYEPIKVHVPVVGDVYMSVNSTSITQPTSLDCNHLSFSGERLVAEISNVAFSAGFNWAYRKPGSSFWHNSGTGEAAIVGGSKVNIDLVKPTSTNLNVNVPVLKLKLHADADKWLYDALTFVTVPLVRGMLNLFGGKFLTHAIVKCLEDPSCPHLQSMVSQMTPQLADVVV